MFEDYKLIIIPFVALIIAQIIKVIIQSVVEKRFSWKSFNQYGGFPSSHSAIVTALATEIAFIYGITSALFALSAVFWFLVIRDATGFRKQLGNHAIFLNKVVKDLPDYKENKYPFLEQTLGHTYSQAAAGVALGVIIALFLV